MLLTWCIGEIMHYLSESVETIRQSEIVINLAKIMENWSGLVLKYDGKPSLKKSVTFSGKCNEKPQKNMASKMKY